MSREENQQRCPFCGAEPALVHTFSNVTRCSACGKQWDIRSAVQVICEQVLKSSSHEEQPPDQELTLDLQRSA